MRFCCVPGCQSGRTARFSIPTNKTIRAIWFSRIKSEKLDELGLEKPCQYQICGRHFHSMCFERENKLKKFSLPTLHLPGYSGESTIDDCFKRPALNDREMLEMPKKIKEMLSTMKPSLTTHLNDDEEELKVTKPKATYCVTSQRNKMSKCFLTNGYNEEPTRENCFFFPTAAECECNVTTATATSTITSQITAMPRSSKDFSPELKVLKTTPLKRKTYIAADPGKIKQKLEDVFEIAGKPSTALDVFSEMSTKKMHKCCVPNCEDKTSRRHRFPKNKEVFNIWIKRINNPKFTEMTATQIEVSGFVCESHFASMNVDKRRKFLLKGSLPTINIPGFNEEPTKNNCFYFSTLKESTEVSVAQEVQSPEKIIPLSEVAKESPEFKFIRTTPQKIRTYMSGKQIKQKIVTSQSEQHFQSGESDKDCNNCKTVNFRDREQHRHQKDSPTNNIASEHLYAKSLAAETAPLNDKLMNTTADLCETSCNIDLVDNLVKTEEPSCDIEMDFLDSGQINDAGCSDVSFDDHEYCRPVKTELANAVEKSPESLMVDTVKHVEKSPEPSITSTDKPMEKSPQIKRDKMTSYAIVKKLKEKRKKSNILEEPFFSNILEKSMLDADIKEETLYDLQNEELMPSASVSIESSIFPELQSTALNIETNQQHKSLIKAIVILQGDKVVNLVSLKQPVKLPEKNSPLKLKTEGTDVNVKEKLRKLVSKIAGNRLPSPDMLSALSNIQGLLNSESEVFKIEISSEGNIEKEAALNELLGKLSAVLPKKRKRSKKREENEKADTVPVKKTKKIRRHPHCRLCLEVIFGESFSLNGTSPKGHQIVDMLAKCVPEINSTSSYKPVICSSCVFSLSLSYEFKMKCLQTEEKINNYRTLHGIVNEKTVHLKRVVGMEENSKIHVSTVEETNDSKMDTSEKENQSIQMNTNAENEKSPGVHIEEIEDCDSDVVQEEEEQHLEQKENLVQFAFDVSKVKFDDPSKEKPAKRYYYINKTTDVQSNYKCHMCNRKFVLERNMKLHYYRDHKISTLYMCKLCGKCFKDVSILKQHIKCIHSVLLNVKKKSNPVEQTFDDF